MIMYGESAVDNLLYLESQSIDFIICYALIVTKLAVESATYRMTNVECSLSEEVGNGLLQNE